MAKKKRTARATEQPDAAPPEAIELYEPLTPQRVHELFSLPGPYEPPAPPLKLKGFTTFWDPGVSIQQLVKRHGALFYLKDFGERCAKDTDSWRWKQIRLRAAEPNLLFAEQRKKLTLGEPPAAREVVAFLVLHFLATGKRIEILRLRCKDVLESGRRVLVGPFSDLGLDIANVSDAWASPGIGLAEICVPKRK